MTMTWENPADKHVNQKGHWTMARSYPHLCVHCGKDYNSHYPWPELFCPKPKSLWTRLRIWISAKVRG